MLPLPDVASAAHGLENGYVETSWESIEHEYWTTHIIRGNYEMMERNKEKLPYDFGEGGLRDVYIWFLWPNLIFRRPPGAE